MTSASAPQIADESTPLAPPDAPRVKVIVTMVEGADLEAALATVDRQVYDGIHEVVVIGTPEDDLPSGVGLIQTLEEAIVGTDSEVDYLWILHSDARPRPDALAALVSELGRNDASLGGSKLLFAGTRDELESIGSATDVFGDPFSGLDEGEIDLQQYDVVREVAFVSSVSMLVRRDLAQGLRGLDELLEPVAAGLDFSQRVRLAGGRVITVPSSEVYHQARCEEQGAGWREEAGRLRAMLKAYRPITLLWVIPFDIMVSVVDSLANLLLFRWRVGARHLASWLWNIAHLPSTMALRRRFRQVRAIGDEELFRFQARGSVRLREVGSEITDLVLSVFDDDQALARGTRRVWSSPGIWGALLAAGIVLAASWSIPFVGVPNTGFSFPFEAPTVAADRFFAGWNDSGLGSADAVHPAVGLTGLISLLWFGAEGAARTIVTLVFAVMAVLGMGRLAGRLGFRGPGRYLSGLVILAGPGTALAVGSGSWLALGAAGVLPWAVRSVVLHADDQGKSWMTHVGWALVWTTLLTAVSPLLGVVPLAAAVLWRLVGGSRSSILLGLATLPAGILAAGFIYDDQGWLFDVERRVGLVVPDWWPVLIAVAAVPIMLVDGRTRRLGFFGAVVGLGGLLLLRLPFGGPGVEEAALVLASFGSGIVVSAAFDRLSIEPRRLLASIAATAILLVSAVSLLDGRLGLPAGDVNDRYAFASTLADTGGAQRILVVSTDRSLVPGEARPGPGVWYRVVDGAGSTLDEAWLPDRQEGDDKLDGALDLIAGGGELRPGLLLAEFSIGWVVVEGEGSPLDTILDSQLDLIPTPLATGARVFENPAALPLAAVGENIVWQKEGAGFAGLARPDSAAIRVSYSHGWGPEAEKSSWFTMVSAEDGEARFSAGGYLRWAPYLAAGLFVLALFLVVFARLRR
ncbi:MAG TPA: glycosyltransferase [Acidimicrobiia bacterium]|nr:glycosyltransferase [Acidimicrobiia bacterium]